jgi:hypothetical protein
MFVLIFRFWNVCDYFVIRARYVYLTNYKKCRTYDYLHFLFFTFFCQINSFVVTACRNRAFIVCPSTGISDSNVYTNETGKRQMILMTMMSTSRNKRKILKRNSEFINSNEFSSSIPIDPNHLNPSTLQRDQKE